MQMPFMQDGFTSTQLDPIVYTFTQFGRRIQKFC